MVAVAAVAADPRWDAAGGGGGGGARPKPAASQAQRRQPTVDVETCRATGASRPNISAPGGGAKPGVNRPSVGAGRPATGNRPNVAARPATRPGALAATTRTLAPDLRLAPHPAPAIWPVAIGQVPEIARLRCPVILVGIDRAATVPARAAIDPPRCPATSAGIDPAATVRALGGDRPTTLPGNIGGNRPGGNRPGPGGDRPILGGDRPTTLPGNIGGNRPGGNRPGPGGDRPILGGERPTTLPGNIGGNRPGGNRPGPGGDRPILGGERPTTLPGIVNRPGVGGGNRPGVGGGDRPILGGGNRPGLGGGGNINIGNDINIGNNWGNNWGNNNIGNNWGNNWGWNRPGFGHGNWSNNWQRRHVHPHHHGWYHGCWGGHWGNNWYAPLAWGAAGWGLGALTTSWGYPFAYTYVNPYYVVSTSAVPAYSYCATDCDQQLRLVAGRIEQTGEPLPPGEPVGAAAPPQESAEVVAGLQSGGSGADSFRAGNYTGALAQIQQAIAKVPGDPVLHEFSALCMFAMKDYQPAAAVLNNLLSVAPGMDWTTMSGLYPSVEVYEKQLSELVGFCESHPDDAAAHFVLAYHRLVCGDSEAAVEALQVVVKQQPKDVVAQRMLQALGGAASPTEPPTAPTTPVKPENVAAGDSRSDHRSDRALAGQAR